MGWLLAIGAQARAHLVMTGVWALNNTAMLGGVVYSEEPKIGSTIDMVLPEDWVNSPDHPDTGMPYADKLPSLNLNSFALGGARFNVSNDQPFLLLPPQK
jgi:hypothetical protein